jgi:hypothetical protein
LLGASLVAFLLAVSEGGSWGWTSGVVVALVGTGLGAGYLWVRAERAAVSPLIDLTMMRLRGIWTTNAIAGLVGFSTFALYGFLPQMARVAPSEGYGLGATVTESCLLLVPSAAASFTIGLVIPWLVRQLGSRAVIGAGCCCIAGSLFALAVWHESPGQIVAWSTAFGLGSGLVIATLPSIVVSAVPSAQTGVASGMNANIRTVGGSIGAAAMAAVIAGSVEVSGSPSEAGYVIGFLMLGSGMVVAALVAVRIP